MQKGGQAGHSGLHPFLEATHHNHMPNEIDVEANTTVLVLEFPKHASPYKETLELGTRDGHRDEYV